MSNGYGEFSEQDELRIINRCLAFRALYAKFKLSFIRSDLRKYVCLDELRLQTVVGRYWNDLLRLKQWHDFEHRIHRTKITAYTIRWILALPPIYTTISLLEYKALDEEMQQRIRDVNYWYAVSIIFFVLHELDPEDFRSGGKYERITKNLIYNMKTSGYNEKMAVLLFEAFLANAPKVTTDGTS